MEGGRWRSSRFLLVSSFPRKRESRATSEAEALDSRFRGNDGSECLNRQFQRRLQIGNAFQHQIRMQAQHFAEADAGQYADGAAGTGGARHIEVVRGIADDGDLARLEA